MKRAFALVVLFAFGAAACSGGFGDTVPSSTVTTPTSAVATSSVTPDVAVPVAAAPPDPDRLCQILGDDTSAFESLFGGPGPTPVVEMRALIVEMVRVAPGEIASDVEILAVNLGQIMDALEAVDFDASALDRGEIAQTSEVDAARIAVGDWTDANCLGAADDEPVTTPP